MLKSCPTFKMLFRRKAIQRSVEGRRRGNISAQVETQQQKLVGVEENKGRKSCARITTTTTILAAPLRLPGGGFIVPSQAAGNDDGSSKL